MTDAARAPLSRRAALAGAAGLVVGAGGAGAVAAATTSGADTGPRVASANEELMTEHGVLKRVLLVYRAATERLDAGTALPPGAIADAAQLVADYVEGFHEGLEEAYVFPRVAEAQPTLIRTLLQQHDRGRHLTARIQDAATATGSGARTALRRDLAAFVRMYEPHEAWEDTVVYPELRRLTPQRTLDALAERFADLQDAKYGDHALATMVARIGGVEEQLGVHDLASFTPRL